MHALLDEFAEFLRNLRLWNVELHRVALASFARRNLHADGSVVAASANFTLEHMRRGARSRHGFAVGDGRLIATNAHVVPEVLDSERMEVVAIAIASGQTGVVRRAERVASDKEHDLAVLRIEGAALPALELAPNDGVREGQSIAFTGFPIGNALGLSPVTHRGIVSAITPIGIPLANARDLNPALIRRLSGERFEIYQLDATAYPGNSGSPVFDPGSGQIIGVINMVFVKRTKESVLSDPSGISYAIPVTYLRAMLQGLR